MSELQHAATVEVIVTFFASLAFLLAYTAVAPWWRSSLGRNLVSFDVALSLTLLPSVIHHLFGATTAEDQTFAWFTVISFGLVPLVIAWRTWILIRLQLAGVEVDNEAGGGR